MNAVIESRNAREMLVRGHAGTPHADVKSAHAKPSRPRTRFLMCAPTHFAVEYAINPWMAGQCDRVDASTAMVQWTLLRDVLGRHADIECLAPMRGLPDLPFTANAGLVQGGVFVPSHFRHPERRGEEACNRRWFADAGFDVRSLPDGLVFEGAGDALFDHRLGLLWMGHGQRSDAAAARAIECLLDIDVVPLHLVDPRFYHLDTCFCPLLGGVLLWYPSAFDAASRALVESRIAVSRRIAVSERDALAFACNAVSLGSAVVVHRASGTLKLRLDNAGFTVIETPLDEFHKSGGSAKCLTLAIG